MSEKNVTLLDIILLIVRLIFLPVKLVHFLIYGNSAPVIVGYCWYSRKNYEAMVAASDDDKEDIVPTYELWVERAVESIETMSAKKWVVVKINVNTPRLLAWLKGHNLPNTRENREKYAAFRIEKFRGKGI